ncbi:dolichyl pyrophosphate Glc1Man9GlcNAc2 alpha-1,3-glucosyltransferase-like [Asterias amurensis]|uniref:dolichyl pyrophosphate Glc1Man9GlcNAc2 alpha-1,3-glucosyltransferase-like n=1 Tax=Asterias amurensis TaxID=7602 RepID=UPI003AB1E345
MAAPMEHFVPLVVFISTLKVLLIPAYRSTDFEVHRNWLAITHSLPISKWYFEDTSEWTLDYPPFFAWFEFGLSQVAKFFDPGMLDVANLNYASPATVIFQRLSVIITDLVFIYAAKEYCLSLSKRTGRREYARLLEKPHFLLAVLLVCNFGLILLDHIHFQYNGFLFGLMLLSITRITEGRNLEGAFWFAVLLNFKHIYLYVAPAYFIYLLRSYCFTRSNPDGGVQWTSLSPLRLVGLGGIVISVFAASFGPFIAMGQLPQVLTRLFPFKRGLCHSYWAPNFWALYNMLDKMASMTGERFNLLSDESLEKSRASMTGGLVQEFHHIFLPSVPAIATLVLTALTALPSLLHLWRYPSGPKGFLRCLVLCAYSSFMFGYHVHEKAILLVIIPLSLLAMESLKDAQVFLIVSTVGHYSLFPLLFTQNETPIKVCLMLAFTIFTFISTTNIHRYSAKSAFLLPHLPHLSPVESLYLLGLVPLFIYKNLIHDMVPALQRYEFLPLMLTSAYCALGVGYAWLKFNIITLGRGGGR